MSVLRFIDEMT